jgi:hypothetical protein
MSSFEEPMWIDSDIVPLVDPYVAYDISDYKATGALGWMDICNFFSVREEAFDVFGLPTPAKYPYLAYSQPQPAFLPNCDNVPESELEGSVLVLDKRRAWKGLWLTTFVNIHHEFFLIRLFYGEKQVRKKGFVIN